MKNFYNIEIARNKIKEFVETCQKEFLFLIAQLDRLGKSIMKGFFDYDEQQCAYYQEDIEPFRLMNCLLGQMHRPQPEKAECIQHYRVGETVKSEILQACHKVSLSGTLLFYSACGFLRPGPVSGRGLCSSNGCSKAVRLPWIRCRKTMHHR